MNQTFQTQEWRKWSSAKEVLDCKPNFLVSILREQCVEYAYWCKSAKVKGEGWCYLSLLKVNRDFYDLPNPLSDQGTTNNAVLMIISSK